ncbi:alpha-(1-_3)-arabinofuranosyltransferase family protein [Blastococcus sp. URHD0036]|uniref:alpha-(1->3)-arabinofuranosyltransferase domain-containing protein n=1 Tax=Blastococcus sp. URHD0036 TaxID=1380356 RepID=UPI00068AF269|nr:alpha-(1->3)-arabinofuranosyltransferase family protein [Blastococcus sp. URHD0036]
MATIALGERTGSAPADPAGPRAGAPVRLRRVLGLLDRFRLALVCLGFVLLSVLQQPGKVVGDTKLDLAVDPIGYLGRALSLWDPEGGAGQLHNQEYGYFFPMGPFFALGQILGLPPWLVQRLWLALLLSVAFLGVVVLARRLRIGTPATALVAGIAYALAPRMVTSLGATSIEALPMAMAPWVVVPLVGVALHGSARRAAMRSGLVVFCIGGVNAVATAAALPLGALYLLTRPPGPLRRRLIGWWVLAVGLATAWWTGPLLLLGRYGTRFLEYTETAAATTAPTDVLSVLRGTSHWVAYINSAAGPTWPAGWSLVKDVVPAGATVVLAAAGLAALCRRDLPERRWLVLGALTGVVLLTMGHLAAVDGLGAGWLHEALNGPLAPLRNVHKFDPVLRLPLVLGLAHLGAVLVRRSRRRDASGGATAPSSTGRPVVRLASRVLLAVLTLALVATASPALAGRLVPSTGFEELPGYWEETADFLASEQPSGRALLVPASSFGTYAWGSTGDEPMQPLARSPWDVRNQIPLTPEGHIRMLDAVEARLSLGEGSAGLAAYLARAGISHVVLRNDLDTSAAGLTRSILVRQALRNSPGITPLVADFGPVVGETVEPDGALRDGGLVEPAPAVQVYVVADAAPQAWTAPLSSAVGVYGGPDAVLELEDRGLVTDLPTVTAGTGGVSPDSVMVGDAWVRRERNFGRISAATSAGLTASDPLRQDNPARDYTAPEFAGAEGVVAYFDGTPSASSSASDPNGFSPPQLDAQPWSALDHDPLTSWRPARWADPATPPWWRLTTWRPFSSPTVVVRLGAEFGAERPTQLRLTTDAGEVTVPVADTSEPQVLPLPSGSSTSLTITAVVDDPTGATRFSLAEVEIAGVDVQRTVLVPRPDEPVAAYAFDVSAGRSGCVEDAVGASRCSYGLLAAGEESTVLDRVFTTVGAGDYDVTATAMPRPGPSLDAMLAEVRGGPTVQASSTSVADPRGSGAAVLDGDPGTTWVASGLDEEPTLTLDFGEVRLIDSLRVVTTPGVAAAVPSVVTIDDGGGLQRTVRLDDDGVARFAAVETDRLSVTFQLPDTVESVDPQTLWRQSLGIGVSELEVGGPNPVTAPETPLSLPCGFGPDVLVDGVVLQTAATTTVGAVTAAQPIPLEVCSGTPEVALDDGEHRLQALANVLFRPESVTLTRAGASTGAAPDGRTPAERTRWDADHRTVEIGARSEPTLLVVPENVNPGWVARMDGQVLEAVTVDGWQQGYVLPAGPAGTVRLDFGPATEYELALAGGAGAVLLLALVCVLPARPGRIQAGSGRRSTASAARAAAGLLVVLTLGMALIGGVLGVASLGLLWLVGRWAGRRRAVVLGSVAAGALLASGLLLLTLPDGNGTTRQVLAITALAAVAAAVLPVHRPRFRRRTHAGTPAPG